MRERSENFHFQGGGLSYEGEVRKFSFSGWGGGLIFQGEVDTPLHTMLNNIDPYHQLFIVFAYLLVSTVFTGNVYFSFRFFLEFIIYGLFLFAISPLVRQVTMLLPSEDFFYCLRVLSRVCLFCCFCLCLVTTQGIVPFHLGIVIQEIEIVQKAFC